MFSGREKVGAATTAPVSSKTSIFLDSAADETHTLTGLGPTDGPLPAIGLCRSIWISTVASKRSYLESELPTRPAGQRNTPAQTNYGHHWILLWSQSTTRLEEHLHRHTYALCSFGIWVRNSSMFCVRIVPVAQFPKHKDYDLTLFELELGGDGWPEEVATGYLGHFEIESRRFGGAFVSRPGEVSKIHGE